LLLLFSSDFDEEPEDDFDEEDDLDLVELSEDLVADLPDELLPCDTVVSFPGADVAALVRAAGVLLLLSPKFPLLPKNQKKE